MSNMSQKQKGLIGLGAMVVLGAVTVLGSDPIYKAIDSMGKEKLSFTAGTYTATAQGFGGDIVATVTVDASSITAVELVGDSETPGLGGTAIEVMPAQILEAQSTEVDGQTGATISSTAIKEAVNSALAQAKGEAPVEAAPVAAKAEETKAEETKAEETKAEETKAEETKAAENTASYKDGTYTATEKGFGGDIEVTLTVEGGKITKAEIVGDAETPGLGGKAVEDMPAQIADAQGADVDGVAGATISSTAIKTAVETALKDAQ